MVLRTVIVELTSILISPLRAEKYSELTDEETGRVLRKYARQQNYSRKLLSLALPALTGNTAKKLIEWGIIYEFAS